MPEDGTITIGTDDVGENQAALTVEDNGQGMSKDVLAVR
ncbi:MAG: signal transduction histidine kinase [Planctomycetota bacterium]|jgi:signal transduction histidine kinase